jgi:SAM-dependent methyltransferase
MNGPAAAVGPDDWSQHWEDFGDAASRNPAQEYRRRLALRFLGDDGAPVRLLDIGSGQGDFLAAARRRWPRAALAGLEMSEVGIAQARAKVPDARLELRDLTTQGEPSPQLAGWGTHALCSEVLEHVDDPTDLLAEALTYLAPGALIVITVPGGPMSAFDRHIGHRQHFTPRSLAQVVRGAGLDVDWAAGAGFPFFNLYRRVVIARGERLIDDIATREHERPRIAGRVAMAAFRPLFRVNLTRSRWGTQIVAVARTRAGSLPHPDSTPLDV